MAVLVEIWMMSLVVTIGVVTVGAGIMTLSWVVPAVGERYLGLRVRQRAEAR